MDITGHVVSSSFHVRDADAFQAWFEKYRFGDEITVHQEPSTRTDGQGAAMCFSGCESYPSAWPRLAYEENDDEPQERDAELACWASELREHLLEDELVHVIACGAAQGRCAVYEVLAVDHRTTGFRSGSTDDPKSAGRLLEAA